MAKKNEEEEEEQPGKWDDYEDLFEGEDDSVIASAKARHLARKMQDRAEQIAKKKPAKKKSSGWL